MHNRANHGRLKRLLTQLLHIYHQKIYPFNQAKVQPPQLLLPEDFPRGGLTHAFFLFVLCYWMRGGIESDTAILSLSQLYRLDKDLFDPFLVQEENPEHLADLLKYAGLGFSKDSNSSFWVGNAKLLVSEWGGDPRNIFSDFSKYGEKKKWEVAVSRIKNKGNRGLRGGFAGFREKMVSMLIYFLMEQGLIEEFDFPIPVDFHVARMLVIHRVFELDPSISYTGGHLDRLLDDMRYTSYRYAKRHHISSLDLSNVLWLYSRSMCSENPDFEASTGSGSGRSIEIIIPEISWSKAEQRAYARTCGSCTVANSCCYVVRSKHWYKHGSIVRDTNKQEPGQALLLAPNENAMTYKGGAKNVRWKEAPEASAMRAALRHENDQAQMGLPFEPADQTKLRRARHPKTRRKFARYWANRPHPGKPRRRRKVRDHSGGETVAGR